MAKLTGPLLSFSALGTIADTVTYSRWKGIDFARQRVIPANPNTTEQQTTRSVFSTLSGMWKVLPALGFAPWDANAVGRPYTGRNRFMGDNLTVIRGESDMQNFLGSPGSLAGPATPAISAAFSSPNITITCTPPTLPNGWTIQAAVGIGFPDQDPEDVFGGPVLAAEDAVDPFTAVVLDTTGAPTGTWVCSAWYRFLRDDGRVAYGFSAQDTVTVS